MNGGARRFRTERAFALALRALERLVDARADRYVAVDDDDGLDASPTTRAESTPAPIVAIARDFTVPRATHDATLPHASPRSRRSTSTRVRARARGALRARIGNARASLRDRRERHGQGRDQGGGDPGETREHGADGVLLRQAQEPQAIAEEARVREVRSQGAWVSRFCVARRFSARARCVAIDSTRRGRGRGETDDAMRSQVRRHVLFTETKINK